MIDYRDVQYECHTEITLAVISGKWKSLILWDLYHHFPKALRFNELRRLLPRVTQKVLTQQLKEMEDDKLIIRKTYHEMPPRVEYSLSKSGECLAPVLELLARWGEDHKNYVAAEMEREKLYVSGLSPVDA
jgi:DNA-binding HxlR family transcriptional regulator